MPLPPQTLRASRDAFARRLPDRAVLLRQLVASGPNLWRPGYVILLSGLPLSGCYPGYRGSGVPAQVIDAASLATVNMQNIAQSLNIGFERYREVTLAWHISYVLKDNPDGYLRRDDRIVIGGSLSGGTWVGGEVYQVAQIAREISEPIDIVAYCRYVSRDEM